MPQTTYMRLLSGQTVAGASGSGMTQGAGDGPICSLIYPHMAASVQVEITGNATACVVNIMGLLDGSTWSILSVLDISQGYISGELQELTFPAVIRYVKANLATLTGTGTSVSCYFGAVG